MNKYQQAYDTIWCKCNTYSCDCEKYKNKKECENCDYVNALDILQELMNEFDMLLQTNNQFEKENIKLEKALDNACKELEEEGCCGYFNSTELCNMPFSCRNCWKEYLLKEEKNV